VVPHPCHTPCHTLAMLEADYMGQSSPSEIPGRYRVTVDGIDQIHPEVPPERQGGGATVCSAERATVERAGRQNEHACKAFGSSTLSLRTEPCPVAASFAFSAHLRSKGSVVTRKGAPLGQARRKNKAQGDGLARTSAANRFWPAFSLIVGCMREKGQPGTH